MHSSIIIVTRTWSSDGFESGFKHETGENKLFKSEKIGERLFLFVTALDDTIIATPNFELLEDCWDQLPQLGSGLETEPKKLSETSIYRHLGELIQKDKYSFLYSGPDEYFYLLNLLGGVELPAIFWKEINWLKRFGYYYHHTIAMAALIAKYCLDTRKSHDATRISLQAAFVHDIGIARLPHSILFSSQQFKEDEIIMMQQHPLVSYLLYGYYTGGAETTISKGILHHHCPDVLEKKYDKDEHQDAKEIAWLLFNMDIYDALISNRPFRPAFGIKNAIDYLRQVNHALSLPLDVVNWLEKQCDVQKLSANESNLIPIKPRIGTYQMN